MKFVGNIKDWAFVIFGMIILEILISLPYMLFFKDTLQINPAIFSNVLSLGICFFGGILYSKRYKVISNPDIFLMLVFKIVKDFRISDMDIFSIISLIITGMLLYIVFLAGIVFSYKFLNKDFS